MGIYSGKFKRERLYGEIKEIPGVKGRITKPKRMSAEVTPIPSYRAKWGGGIFFSAVTTVLDFICRFIDIRSVLRVRHKVKPHTAPGKEIEADRTQGIEKTAPLESAEAAEINAHCVVLLNLPVRLNAYVRAGLAYARRILMGRSVNVTTSPGACAKYHETIPIELTSEAETAKAETMQRKNSEIVTELVSAGMSAPARCPVVEQEVETQAEAQPGTTANIAEVGINAEAKTTKIARLYSWCLPEVDGDSVKLFQIFSGVQNYDTLEIDLEEESAYWANAFNENGVMTLVFAQTEPQSGNILEVV